MSTLTDNFKSYETFKYGGGWPEIVKIPVHDSFPQFARLPIELRLKIWTFVRYVQKPRIIEAYRRGPECPGAPCEWHCVSPCAKILPPGFHVCREARQETMRYLTWLPWGVWFDYERDYLLLGFNISLTEIYHFITDNTLVEVKKLRYLAIADHTQSLLESLEKRFLKKLLKNLEELTIINYVNEDSNFDRWDWAFEACNYSYFSNESIEQLEIEAFDELGKFLRSFKKSDDVENPESSSDWNLPELQARGVTSSSFFED